MKKAILNALVPLCLVSLAGCACSAEYAAAPPQPVETPARPEADVARLGGIWTGKACQSDGPCWSVQVALAWDDQGTPIGNIAYPSVPCKAHLEFVRWEEGGVAAFRERFDDPGRCVPDGWLRLRLQGEDSLSFVWAYPDGRVDVGTTLDRYREE